MASEANTALVLRHIEDTFNSKAGRLGADRYWAPRVVNFGNEISREQLGALFDQLLEAFPDWHFTVEHVVADREWVVCATTMRGTYRAATLAMIADVAPTDQPVEWRQNHWFRVADGRIAEHFAYRDDLGLRNQVLSATTSD
ncbi:MAG: ester cyclase [Aeromicrobium sp.]